MGIIGSNNPNPSVLFEETEAVDLVANPAAGQRRLIVDASDHLLYLVDPAGVATLVGGATDHGALTGLADDDHTQYLLRSVLTTRGDLFRRGAAAIERVALGTNGQVLTSDGTDAGWATPASGFADPMTTRGDIIHRNAANATARLGRGSAGQVLTSDGTDIAWGTPAAGALVLLEQHTASASASLDFTSCISATYDEYQIDFVGIVPATNSVAFWMRMSTNGGSSYDASAIYGWSAYVSRAAATANTGAEGGATKIQLGYANNMSNNASWGLQGQIRLYHPGHTTLFKRIEGFITALDVGPFRILSGCQGSYESATAVNAFQFLMSSGNIASGTIRVYGIAK